MPHLPGIMWPYLNKQLTARLLWTRVLRPRLHGEGAGPSGLAPFGPRPKFEQTSNINCEVYGLRSTRGPLAGPPGCYVPDQRSNPVHSTIILQRIFIITQGHVAASGPATWHLLIGRWRIFPGIFGGIKNRIFPLKKIYYFFLFPKSN